MIAVITGDIINSQKSDSELWLPKLKELLGSWSTTPENWEVYRGDEFQLKCGQESSHFSQERNGRNGSHLEY